MKAHPTSAMSAAPAGPPAQAPGAPAADAPQPQPAAKQRTSEQAARAMMHPDHSDPAWRYYHGGWSG
jgi:hypothetical protein